MASPNPSNSAPPVDFARLELVADTAMEKAELMALFFRLTDEYLTLLENARGDEAFSQWKSAAHGLKGAAANLGMAALAELCHQAEKAAASTFDQRTAILTQIKSELDHINAYIAQQNPALLGSGS